MRRSAIALPSPSSIVPLLIGVALGCASPRVGDAASSSPLAADAAEPEPARVATSLEDDPLDDARRADEPAADSSASHSWHAKGHATRESTTPDVRRDEPKTSYSCPMHPEVKSATPAACPHCGMKLVPEAKRPPATEESHGH